MPTLRRLKRIAHAAEVDRHPPPQECGQHPGRGRKIGGQRSAQYAAQVMRVRRRHGLRAVRPASMAGKTEAAAKGATAITVQSQWQAAEEELTRQR
jgi:hypothetical protein